jgi:hypothetical protein
MNNRFNGCGESESASRIMKLIYSLDKENLYEDNKRSNERSAAAVF